MNSTRNFFFTSQFDAADRKKINRYFDQQPAAIFVNSEFNQAQLQDAPQESPSKLPDDLVEIRLKELLKFDTKAVMSYEKCSSKTKEKIKRKFAAEYKKKAVVFAKSAQYPMYRRFFHQLIMTELKQGMDALGFECRDGYVQRKPQRKE